MKKCALATIAVFITIFITDFIFHGMIMKSMYEGTAHLWRPQADMQPFMPYMLSGQILIALFFTWIFSHGYKGKGAIEGVRYGLLMGGFQTGANLIMYAVTPYPFALTAAWIVFGFVQGMIAGVVAALVWKK